MLLPWKQITRPCPIATSATCWMRYTFDANVATITRPCALSKHCSKVLPISFSLCVKPACSTFVLSESSANTPLEP